MSKIINASYLWFGRGIYEIWVRFGWETERKVEEQQICRRGDKRPFPHGKRPFATVHEQTQTTRFQDKRPCVKREIQTESWTRPKRPFGKGKRPFGQAKRPFGHGKRPFETGRFQTESHDRAKRPFPSNQTPVFFPVTAKHSFFFLNPNPNLKDTKPWPSDNPKQDLSRG